MPPGNEGAAREKSTNEAVQQLLAAHTLALPVLTRYNLASRGLAKVVAVARFL